MKFITLKNHPFAVEAFFERSLVLTYALPQERLIKLIPSCLQLDTYNQQWAFIAMAMVQTKDLRPKGWPKWLGNDFYLIGFRIFVRYVNPEGKIMRGLYIIRSETNKKKMEFFGNIFTHYNYSTTDIQVHRQENKLHVHSLKSDFNISIDTSIESPALPLHSVFPDWSEARKFAGPLPFTFTYNANAHSLLVIEGVREDWKPMPVAVDKQDVGFLRSLHLDDAQLSNAFQLTNIPYYWKKGRIIKL